MQSHFSVSSEDHLAPFLLSLPQNSSASWGSKAYRRYGKAPTRSQDCCFHYLIISQEEVALLAIKSAGAVKDLC